MKVNVTSRKIFNLELEIEELQNLIAMLRSVSGNPRAEEMASFLDKQLSR